MLRFAVIEDLKHTNDQFKAFLEKAWPGCEVKQYLTFETAAAGIAEHDFDLIISDIDLGGGDRLGGFKIAKYVNSDRTPFLIVSGSPQEGMRDIFRALDAWDYLQKPVTEDDFVKQAKRAVTYRMSQIAGSEPAGISAAAGEISINTDEKDPVKWKGKRINITITQVYLLKLLVANVGRAVTFDELFKAIDTGHNRENLRVHIRDIRAEFKSVDPDFNRIATKYNIGYYWSD